MERQRPVAEPYRIKMVEPIPQLDAPARQAALAAAGYNVFRLRADQVAIDLLTDSGTNAMSDRQWAGMMLGDEAYAGSRNYDRLVETVQRLYGFDWVLPVHQGRAAEHVLAKAAIGPGAVIPCNMTFTTTQVLFEQAGARMVNVIDDKAYDLATPHPFKGDVDLDKLAAVLQAHPGKIPFISIGLTVNTAGGQPVSIANLAAVRELADRHGVPLWADAARAMENAFFIQEREAAWADASLAEVLRASMAFFDAAWVSGKKDGLVNIGGFLAGNDPALYRKARQQVVTYEGLHTYGGLAGRDLAAMAIGLDESLDAATMARRVGQARHLADLLRTAGVPIIEPTGGHGVYVDARAFAPHVPADAYPGQALACALYLDAGVRAIEQPMPPREDQGAPLPMIRLALPRRVYTDRHLAVVAESLAWLKAQPDLVRGLRLVDYDPTLRFYTATLAPIEATSPVDRGGVS